jgi:hypothetical protein
MKEERQRVGLLVALATIALVVLLGLQPVPTARLLAAYVLALAAIALAAATRILAAVSWRDTPSRFDGALARTRTHPTRPHELIRIEREITLGTTSAGHLQTRLLPLLREAAAARLGYELELHPERAKAALGNETWELVRPDRPAEASPNGPGISLRRLRSAIERLESA